MKKKISLFLAAFIALVTYQSASSVLDAAMGYYVVGGNYPKVCFKLKGLESLCLYSIKKILKNFVVSE